MQVSVCTMSIRYLLLALLVCATVSAHRLPGEQNTRATFFLSGAEHQAVTGITLPAGSHNVTFSLQYTDTDAPVQSLDMIHEKKLHVLVIGSDLETFFHLHPEDIGVMNYRQGLYTLPLTLQKAGDYLVVLDFSTGGKQQFHKLRVGITGDTPLGEPDLREVRTLHEEYGAELSGDIIVPQVDTELEVTFTKQGVPITDLEPYLGADMHVAVFSANLSHAGHTHPSVPGHFGAMASMAQRFSGPTIPFAYTFPAIGEYVLFVQYAHEGKVFTKRILVHVKDPLAFPYIWFSAGALVVVALAFMYMIRQRVHKRIQ
jgi:hypothetical protein